MKELRISKTVAGALLAAVCLVGPAAADYKQAVSFYMQGRFDKAIQELKPDLDKNPDWEFGHRLVGLSYLNLKNNALAIASLTRATQLKSTSFSTYLGLAQAYFNMQRFDNAIVIMDQGEQFIDKEKEPEKERYKLHHLKGSAYYRLEKYAEAVTSLTAAVRTSGGDWTDYSQLGVSLYQLNRYDEAIQALLKALALKPGQNVSAEYLSKSYFRKGVAELSAKNYQEAINQFTKARDFAPRDGYVHYNLAEAHLFLQDYGQAEKALQQALEIMPRSAEVFQRMGLVYEKQKKWDLSLNAYQKAFELNGSPGLKEAIDRVTELKKR